MVADGETGFICQPPTLRQKATHDGMVGGEVGVFNVGEAPDGFMVRFR